MEALNLAESAIRTKPKQTVCDTNVSVNTTLVFHHFLIM